MNAGAVLIADDDAVWSEAAAGVLREAGWEILLARDSEQAASTLQRQTPALVILDVRLPRRGGLDVLCDFRKRDRHTPVIVVSGDDQAAIQDRAMAAGASLFLRKPVSLPLLVRAVRRQTSDKAAAGIQTRGGDTP